MTRHVTDHNGDPVTLRTCVRCGKDEPVESALCIGCREHDDRGAE